MIGQVIRMGKNTYEDRRKWEEKRLLIFQSLKVDNKNVLAKETEKEWTGKARGKENEFVSQKPVEEMPN